jgi:type II secretory pathway pseudopilin PulG
LAKSVKRNVKGMTIVELLVSILLMGTTFAVIGELVVLNTFASTRLTNAVDGEVGCSRAIRRISEDVRSARIIGNVYAAYAVQNQFPDMNAGSIDPYNSVPPLGGWPSTAFWPSIPYKARG